MTFTINFELEEEPNTCFDCPFSCKYYYFATCPFLKTLRKDGEYRPKNCPLKHKNKNKKYSFTDIFKEIYDNT